MGSFGALGGIGLGVRSTVGTRSWIVDGVWILIINFKYISPPCSFRLLWVNLDHRADCQNYTISLFSFSSVKIQKTRSVADLEVENEILLLHVFYISLL